MRVYRSATSTLEPSPGADPGLPHYGCGVTKPCATAELPELDSNQHNVLQRHVACH